MRITFSPATRRFGHQQVTALRRRVRLALSCLAPRIASVAVALPGKTRAAEQGDCACRVTVKLAEGGQIVVEDRGSTESEALSRAADRAARWVRRQIVLVRHASAPQVSRSFRQPAAVS